MDLIGDCPKCPAMGVELSDPKHGQPICRRCWKAETHVPFNCVAVAVPPAVAAPPKPPENVDMGLSVPPSPRWKFSAVTRAKMSAAKMGRKLSAEHRAKIAAAHRGNALSDDHRAKISAAHKGKKMPPVSAETRAKMSEARKGKKRGKYKKRRQTLVNRTEKSCG